jgi:hypothetical protein
MCTQEGMPRRMAVWLALALRDMRRRSLATILVTCAQLPGTSITHQVPLLQLSKMATERTRGGLLCTVCSLVQAAARRLRLSPRQRAQCRDTARARAAEQSPPPAPTCFRHSSMVTSMAQFAWIADSFSHAARWPCSQQSRGSAGGVRAKPAHRPHMA